MRVISLVLLIIFLAGCSTLSTTCISAFPFDSTCEASGDSFIYQQPKKDKAIIYFYRPYAFYQKNAWPDALINETLLGELRSKGFFSITVPPGEYKLIARKTLAFLNWQIPDMEYRIKAQPNKAYFIRVSATLESATMIGSIPAISGSGSIALIPEKKALLELAGLKKISHVSL